MRSDIRVILSEVETIEELTDIGNDVQAYINERTPYLTLLQENAELKAEKAELESRIAELEEKATSPNSEPVI